MPDLMPETFLATAVVVSSAAAWALLVLRRRASLDRTVLRAALLNASECVGVSLVFLFVNVAVEGALVLAIRAVTGRFVSLYYAGDVMIIPLSCLQGIVVCWWTHLSRRERANHGVAARSPVRLASSRARGVARTVVRERARR